MRGGQNVTQVAMPRSMSHRREHRLCWGVIPAPSRLPWSLMFTRRTFLHQATSSLAGVGLAHLLANDAFAAESEWKAGRGITHHPAKAKRVLQVFCPGAASHMDLWEHKPALDKHHGEPLPGGETLVSFQGPNGNLMKSPWPFAPAGECGKAILSVGVGPNKLAAKLACTLSKPDGLAIVEQDRLRGWLAPLPVRRLWGIGPVTAERLEAHGLSTIGELADAEPSALAAVLGNRAGRFQRLAQGIDEAPVDSERVAKSIGEENTFERDVIDPEVISGALSAHAEVVAARARAAGLAGRTVSLKVKLARRLPTGRSGRVTPWEPVYPVVQRSRTRSVPTDDGTEIREMALWLWRHAHIAEPIRLLGVTLSGLVPADSSGQLELFQGRGALGPTLDAITNRYGPGAIGRATEGLSKQTPSLKKRI